MLTVGIGIAAYPLVRYITRRLERLQQGVDSLGAGDLAARVAVEGKDEVARLAQSFNRAADQIERLVDAHKALLANASHELRTPLARIRLALELSVQQLDPKRKAGLEQDIAELDYLIDEILLASRLGAVRTSLELEEVDLLALAAEECARYDEAILNGAAVSLCGDARLLRRLLRNLLENAHRHGQPPAYVRIERDAAMATLTVWDSGPASRRKNTSMSLSRSTAAAARATTWARAWGWRWCVRSPSATVAPPAAPPCPMAAAASSSRCR